MQILGRALVLQHQFAEAEPTLAAAVPLLRQRGDMAVTLGLALHDLAKVRAAREDWASARAAEGEAVALFARVEATGSWRNAWALRAAAEYAEEAEDWEQAVALWRQTLDALAASARATPLERAHAEQKLALAIVATPYSEAKWEEEHRLLRSARTALLGEPQVDLDRIENGMYLAVNSDSAAESRALLADAAAGVHRRVMSYTAFDEAAQDWMRQFQPVFARQVTAAWELSHPAAPSARQH